MSVYSRTPPEPTLRRGFCFSPFRNGSQPNVPGFAGTGDWRRVDGFSEAVIAWIAASEETKH
jgi:hypothetical protein